jgi:hypothetical protein
LLDQDESDQNIAADYDVLSVVRGTVQELSSLHEQVAIRVRDAIVGETGEGFTAPNKPASSATCLRYLPGQSLLEKRDFAFLIEQQRFFWSRWNSALNMVRLISQLLLSIDGRHRTSWMIAGFSPDRPIEPTDYWQSVGCTWENDAVTCNSS